MSNKLVQRMCLMYGPPETEQPQEWFAEMDRLLKGYGDRELDKAADIVLRTHKGHRYPSVSEMLSAAAEAREGLVERRPAKSEYPEWTDERIEKADELIRCALGRKAANEGWVFALHTFCRKHQRLPVGAEVGGCINEARGFDEAYLRCRSEKNSGLHRALVELGDSMLRMRAFLGEVADGRVRSKEEIRDYLKTPKTFGRAA